MDTIAILARTNRALREPEAALVAANVPYHLIGHSGFWSTEETKVAINYLSACIYPANHVIMGLLRTSLAPTKFLPRTKLTARLKEIKEKDDTVSYWKLMTSEPQTLVENRNLDALRNFVQVVGSLSRYRDLGAEPALKSILSAVKIVEHYAEFEESPDNSPLENLSDLVKLAAKHGTVKDFLDYVRRATAASKKKAGVALSTIHSAKGLEFSTVYVVQCSDGILPHAKSTDLDGERNCFFVGASRAERRLVLTYSGTPSPFLAPFLKPKPEVVV